MFLLWNIRYDRQARSFIFGRSVHRNSLRRAALLAALSLLLSSALNGWTSLFSQHTSWNCLNAHCSAKILSAWKIGVEQQLSKIKAVQDQNLVQRIAIFKSILGEIRLSVLYLLTIQKLRPETKNIVQESTFLFKEDYWPWQKCRWRYNHFLPLRNQFRIVYEHIHVQQMK